MEFKYNDGFFSATHRLIAQVVDETDQYIKDTITKYAMQQAKDLGEEVRVLFIDKSVADEIISLGVKEYLKQKNTCNHQWKDVGYGFGIMRCKKCGDQE